MSVGDRFSILTFSSRINSQYTVVAENMLNATVTHQRAKHATSQCAHSAPHTRETSSTSVAAAMAVVDRYVVCSMSVSKSFAVVLGKYTQRARKVMPMLEKRMRSRMKTTTEIVPGVSDAGRGG